MATKVNDPYFRLVSPILLATSATLNSQTLDKSLILSFDLSKKKSNEKEAKRSWHYLMPKKYFLTDFEHSRLLLCFGLSLLASIQCRELEY